MADARDTILAAAEALRRRDAAAFTAHFLLPFVRVTDHATLVHSSRAELAASALAFFADLDAAGIGALRAGIERVQAIGEGMVIVAYHIRFVFFDGGHGNPFTTVATLRLSDRGWRIACVVNPVWGRALGDEDGLSAGLTGTHGEAR